MKIEPAFLNQLKIVFLKLRTITSQQRFFIFNLIDQNQGAYVNKIVELSKMDQPIVSQNIAVLRKAKFITSLQNNKNVSYTTNLPEIIKTTKLVCEINSLNINLNGTAAEIVTQNFSSYNESYNCIKIIIKENRIKILELLIEKEYRSVNELAEISNQKQSVTSQNLQILKSIGLISDKKKGRQVLYSINSENWEKLVQSINNYFSI